MINNNQIQMQAQKYKKGLEKFDFWHVYYDSGGNKFWCITFTRFGKNTGFLMYNENNATEKELVHAFWNIGISTSLINVVTKGMRDHYTKPLTYLTDLRILLENWQREASAEAVLFSKQIISYFDMVHYYEQTQKEIRQMHLNLLEVQKGVESTGKLIDSDTDKILSISANHNYLKYSQLYKQKETIESIREIDTWLKDNRKRSEFKDIKTLIKYTTYFINKKSTGYIDESLKDFLPYENKEEPIWKMDREKGEAYFMEYYIQEQRQIFQIEMLPMLRNTMRIPV